jgi:hypothetical protein
MPPSPPNFVARLTRDETVEIFKQMDANGNGEISQIEFIKALRRDSALANRLGLPSEIRQEDESRKLFALKYADMDKDQNKAISFEEFLAYYSQETLRKNATTPSFSPPTHPLRSGGGDSSSSVSKSMTQAESPDSAMSAFRVKAAGTQFTCFTGTTVQILTPEELRQGRCGGALQK